MLRQRLNADTAPQRAWLGDVRRMLAHVELDDRVALDRLMRELGGNLKPKFISAFRPEPRSVGWSLELCHLESPARDNMVAGLSDYLKSAPPDFTTFNFLRPNRAERNRIKMNAELPSWDAIATTDIGSNLFPRLGLFGLSTIRALVCDGPMLLAWFGAYREQPFSETDRALWQGILPAVRKRLRFERTLGLGPKARNLASSLDAIAVPAFIVSRNGNVQFANNLGIALFAAQRGAVLSELRQSVAVPGAQVTRFSLAPVTSRGVPDSYLAIVNLQRSPDFSAMLGTAQRRWGLTRRQVEVLAPLLAGDSNKDIATKLNCALGTIELHVSAILRKTGAENRSQLVARFYTHR